MLSKKSILFGLVFLVSLALGLVLFRGGTAIVSDNVSEVDWQLLGEFDYVTGQGPAALTALDGKMVKIPGFMVPLEDNQRKVTEFLLVPTPQACIHVPPPPPNQMVLVDMEPGRESEVAFGPIWIYGKLMLKSKRHQYGESSFSMQGVKIEPYR